MNKIMLNRISVLTVAFFLFLTSCEKDNTNSASVIGKATVSGIAYINLNLKDDTNTGISFEKAPTGSVLYATILSSDLVLNTSSSSSYSDLVYKTTVDNNGGYTFTIPANLKNVTVTITSDDYRLDQTNTDNTKTSFIYTIPAGTYSAKVTDGTSRIVDVYFDKK